MSELRRSRVLGAIAYSSSRPDRSRRSGLARPYGEGSRMRDDRPSIFWWAGVMLAGAILWLVAAQAACAWFGTWCW